MPEWTKLTQAGAAVIRIARAFAASIQLDRGSDDPPGSNTPLLFADTNLARELRTAVDVYDTAIMTVHVREER